MNYLMWRQHRSQVVFAGSALGALALVLLVSGTHIASAYEAAVRACGGAGDCTPGANLFQNDGILFDLIGGTALAPALFGLFWGAPLVARELESGTLQLAWTQTVTRRRWIGVKVAWMLGAAAAWGAAISALVTWWSGPVNAVFQYRFDLGHFDTQGLVPIGYSVFAVALGIAAGTFTRRIMPALATTLGIFTVVRFGINYLARPHYLAPLIKRAPVGGVGALGRGSNWVIGTTVVNGAGRAVRPIMAPTGSTLPSACADLARSGAAGAGQLTRCLDAQGWRTVVTYQPADRFWTFQGIETAIYLVLAAVLVAVTFRLISARDA